MSNAIKIDDFKVSLRKLVDELERHRDQQIIFEVPGYWYVTSDTAFDIYGTQKLALGEFDDCVRVILEVANEEAEVSASFFHALSAVAGYLSARGLPGS